MIDKKLGKFLPPLPGEARVGPIAAIPTLLREFGVSPGMLLKRFNIGEEHFRQPDNTISFETVGRIFHACAQATACAHFGLLVGQRGDASTLGATGFLLRNAPDVLTALSEAIKNSDLQDRGATPFLEVSDDAALIGYEIFRPEIEGASQIADAALAIIWNVLWGLCGPAWLPVEVHLRRDVPADTSAYQRFFKAPLRFNAVHNAIIFAPDWLAKPIQLADPIMRQHFLRHLQEMRQYSNQDFRGKAFQALLLLLRSQRCTREELAKYFAMHPRTLNRRLLAAGTSFRELHNEARHQTACQLLCDTGSNIEIIGMMLGYSDGAAFSRAFAKWEGTSPAKWRRDILSFAGHLKNPT